MVGVGIPYQRPISWTTVTSGSISIGPAALKVLQHRGLVRADPRAPSMRRSTSTRKRDARWSAMSLASSIIAFATARVPGSEGVDARVASVSALIGLKETFPHSFSQISSRMLSITGASSPAGLEQRGETLDALRPFAARARQPETCPRRRAG